MNISYGDSGLLIKYIQMILKERIDTTIEPSGKYDKATHIGVKKLLARIDPRIKYLYTDVSVDGVTYQLLEDGISYFLDFVIHPARVATPTLAESISTENYNMNDTSGEGSNFRALVHKSIVEDPDLWVIVPKEITTIVKAKVYYYYLDHNSRTVYIRNNDLESGVSPDNWYDSRYNYQPTIDNNYLFTYITNDHQFVTHKFDKIKSYNDTDEYYIRAVDSEGNAFYEYKVKLPKGITLMNTETHYKDNTKINKIPGYWYEELSDSEVTNTITKEKYHKRYWSKDTGYPQSDIEDIDYAQKLLISIYQSGEDLATSKYYPEIYSSIISTPEVITSGYNSMTEDVYQFLSSVGVPLKYQLGVIDPSTEELLRRYISLNYTIT